MSDKKVKFPTPSVMQNPDAVEDLMERFVKPAISRNRTLTIVTVQGVVISVLSILLIMIFPLKQIVPYYIDRNKDTGEAISRSVMTQEYEPTDAEIKYYSNKFFENAMTIEPGRVDYRLAEAGKLVKGKANLLLREQIIEGMQPVYRSASDLTLTQTYNVSGTNILSKQDKSILVRFSTIERTKDAKPKIKNWQVTARYNIVPPKSEKEILNNPLGFYIVDFAMTEEIEKVNK